MPCVDSVAVKNEAQVSASSDGQGSSTGGGWKTKQFHNQFRCDIQVEFLFLQILNKIKLVHFVHAHVQFNKNTKRLELTMPKSSDRIFKFLSFLCIILSDSIFCDVFCVIFISTIKRTHFFVCQKSNDPSYINIVRQQQDIRCGKVLFCTFKLT